MNLYRNESSNPKWNAQRNLQGRTHYVDDDTLRFHKSKILSARHTANGLLFAIVTSDALDMNNTKRGFRYVIFDLFGNVLDRPKLKESFRSSEKATKAMWNELNSIDAVFVTRDAITKARFAYEREMDELHATVTKIAEKAA